MAVSDWVEGARLRTLPAAVAPILAGTAIAVHLGAASWIRAVLAALVALLLQIGCNLANDYSDGIRGTDDVRTGPPRLTGGGLAEPRTVKLAAFGCFGFAAVLGLILVALCGQWWLIAIGVAAILAAWFYTGGDKPYGYMGLGEIFVFVFFGLVATAGTTYTQALRVPWQAWLASCAIGFIACGLLMINNIRDIPTDAKVGKNTLAVRMGERAARASYVALTAAPALLCLAFVGDLGFFVLVIFVPTAFFAVRAIRPVLAGAKGRELIAVLKLTGLTELCFGLTTLMAYLLQSCLG